MLNQTNLDPVRSPLDEARRKASATAISPALAVFRGHLSRLNIGTGSNDDQAPVRARVARLDGRRRTISDRLRSTPDVIARSPLGERPGDAVVTDQPGIATAFDGRFGVVRRRRSARIGAAHAGWKGALTGVLENTISAMEGLGARRERIVAVLGPSIGPENYEVGPEFVARFVEANAGNARYFAPSATTAHAMFDLNLYTVDRLTEAGVQAEGLGRCTYAEEDLFYSYRRTTHRKEADYGRQVSAIVLEKE